MSTLILIGVIVIKIAILLGFAMTMASLLTWQERKQSAAIQDRIGPNRAEIPWVKWRLWGLVHIVADTVKMFFKEDFTPPNVNKPLFQLAPMLAIIPATLVMAAIPFGGQVTILGQSISLTIASMNAGMLFVLAVGSLGVYSAALGGYASGNKFGLIGAMRGSAQLMSYELAQGLALVGLFMVCQSASLIKIADWQAGAIWRWGVVVQPLGFLLFFAAAVAETKRSPFDLPEGESEIIGYFIEHSGLKFGMFFIGEFLEVVIAAMLITTLYFGSYHLPFLEWSTVERALNQSIGGDWLPGLLVGLLMFAVFVVKTLFFIMLQLQIRWTLPRMRYDQLMRFGWKFLLPLALLNLLVTAVLLLVLS